MPKSKRISKKLGRQEEIAQDELVRRYAAMKRFLEDNWGRIGQQLQRVRKPENVKSILDRVPSAEWFPAFRDFPTGCLLRDGTAKVSWRQVRETREKYVDATGAEGRLSLESHNARQLAQSAKIALDAAVAEYKQEQDSKRVQRKLNEIEKQLRVEELTSHAEQLGASLRAAQSRREFLEKLLATQEAWLARNEVVSFVRDRKRRYRKTPANFAKVMAGLPFYDWLYSIRKCISMPRVKSVTPTYWFRVFEMLKPIVKRTRPANLRKIEVKLKSELLRQGADPLFMSYISPQWHYITLAFADCRGKRIRPAHLPYKIMERFLDHYEGPSVAEAELAKHNQLLQTSSQ
jgi:hypothetical protein